MSELNEERGTRPRCRRYRDVGGAHRLVMDLEGVVRDLGPWLTEAGGDPRRDGAELVAGRIAERAPGDFAGLPLVEPDHDGRPLPIIVRPGKIIALGRTFPAHARELANPVPKEPLVFVKLGENIVGSGESLALPWQDGERFDNEVEVAALIGRPLRDADVEEARRAVAGWFLLNDFTWRSEQGRAKAKGEPWTIAKNLPGCLPVGDVLAIDTDPRRLRFTCMIDGVLRQSGDFAGMACSPEELVARLSRRVPLAPGDAVALGTPKGVTSVRPGERVAVEVEGLGRLEHLIVEKER